jgi:hypothetical protein
MHASLYYEYGMMLCINKFILKMKMLLVSEVEVTAFLLENFRNLNAVNTKYCFDNLFTLRVLLVRRKIFVLMCHAYVIELIAKLLPHDVKQRHFPTLSRILGRFNQSCENLTNL